MMGLNCSATREPGRPMDGAMLSRRFRNPEIGNVDEIVRELAEIRDRNRDPFSSVIPELNLFPGICKNSQVPRRIHSSRA